MKLNKSFARRIGKSLSKSQQDLLENELPKYLFDQTNLLFKNTETQDLESSLNPTSHEIQYVAEIGMGMGDHFVARAVANPSAIHIAFEPYLNGVANCLKLALEQKITNILLWPDDMDLIFNELPDNFLDELYILFPDPWPKLRHHKRRIINSTRLKLFANKLKPKGEMHFASDIDHYFDFAHKQIDNSGYFNEITVSENAPKGYTKTRYHMKAEEEFRQPRFLRAKKSCSIINQN